MKKITAKKRYRIRPYSVAYWTIKIVKVFIPIALITFAACVCIDYLANTHKVDAIEVTENTKIVEEIPKTEKENPIDKYDIPLSDDLKNYTINMCKLYNISPTLIFAMMDVESNYKTDLVGDNGNSIGILQIQPRWNKERMKNLGISNLSEPHNNISVGIDILAEKISAGKGIEWALMAYNGGNAYADKHLKNGTTSTYVQKVLNKMEEIS